MMVMNYERLFSLMVVVLFVQLMVTVNMSTQYVLKKRNDDFDVDIREIIRHDRVNFFIYFFNLIHFHFHLDFF